MHHVGRAASGTRHLLSRLAPFGLQMLVSSAAYGSGLMAVQFVGMALRVSCATPMVGPVIGAGVVQGVSVCVVCAPCAMKEPDGI